MFFSFLGICNGNQGKELSVGRKIRVHVFVVRFLEYLIVDFVMQDSVVVK